MKDLAKSLERLYALRTFGIKPGLETEQALLERLGNPQHGFVSIHVAGTNGKGSVCTMLDAVLRKAGFRVGLYTSPHLIRFNERIRVGGECIADKDLAALFEDMEGHAAAITEGASGREVTFFEFTTALAFEHFRRQGVQVAVVEAGMGGRLDATNLVLPLVSVITRIGLDHMVYLGDTVEAIAGEKAGIVKEGRPVVMGAMPEEAGAVIRAVAAKRNAPCIDASAVINVRRVSQSIEGQKVAISSETLDYGTAMLPLLGRHQLENCATAMAVLEAVAQASPIAVAPDVVRAGLAAAVWPGRMQVLSATPPVILDGAHNPDGARALAATLKELFRKQPIGLIWGMCGDKDAVGFAAELSALVKKCWAVPIDTERSLEPGKLAALARHKGWPVAISTVPDALADAQRWAAENRGAVCIAGSLFLAGEVLGMREKA